MPSNKEKEEESTTETGKVKFYKVKEAYGFITSDIDKKELFVHRTDIRGAPGDDIYNPLLLQGERVRYKRLRSSNHQNEKWLAQDVVFESGKKVPIYRPDVSTRYCTLYY